MSKAKKEAAAPDRPAAGALFSQLEALVAAPASADRGRKAWAVLARDVGGPDFHPVLDFALENELVAGCEVGDPRTDPTPTWINPADEREMVWIPPGRFVVGEEGRLAECAGFSLARYPVTNRQFQRFLKESGYAPDDAEPAEEDGETGYVNGSFLQHWQDGKPPAGKADHPVVFVSYLDALAYCRWGGLSLPGEFQWEKAARGPDGRAYPWGDDWLPMQLPKLAHVKTADTSPVGKFAKVRSPYGCEELVGNVSEWCQPGDEKNPEAFPHADPGTKPPKGNKKVFAAVRGSAFMRQGAALMKSSHRRKLSVFRRNHWVGFRPACFLPCRPAV